MEEIRRAGQAHYDNMSSLEKEMVKQMFASHAANGEGRISRQDVFIQFANSMPTSNIASFFSMIDKDNNGFLDFSEFVTLHYVTHSRPPCNCCKKIVNGLYFCCERCWEMHVRSRVEFQPYELCSECYYGKRFIHEHHEFLDNFMLLRSVRFPLILFFFFETISLIFVFKQGLRILVLLLIFDFFSKDV